MKTLSSTCLLFLVLCCLSGPARSRTLILNSCSINVHLEELHGHYSSIRLSAVSGCHRTRHFLGITSIPHRLWFLWISDRSRWRDRCEISEQIIDWWSPGEVFFWSFPNQMQPFKMYQIVLIEAKRLHQLFRTHLSSSWPVIHTSWEHLSNRSASLRQVGQRCCFLRLVLRFYVERVFGNYASAQSQDQSSVSSLANTFVIIRRQIHKCVSHLRSETGGKKTNMFRLWW